MENYSAYLRFFSLLLVVGVTTPGCEKPITEDPVSALNGLVQEYGYIGYTNPLENSGTGTMLGGRPSALAFVAPASDCFSPDELPRFYDTQHFRKKYTYEFQGSLGFTTFGSALFQAGASLNKKHTVNVEINGLTMEYMSSIDVTEHYRNGVMLDTCKEYLDSVGFVIQALSTDSMKISITKIGGTRIGLNADNISQFIDFEADVNWEFSDSYTVEITTPKYIGYQLGKLRYEDNGMVLKRAMTAEDDTFFFETIALFDVEEEDNKILKFGALDVSEFDRHSIDLD